MFGDERATIVFGAVESKDVSGVIENLREIAGRWVITGVNSPRSLDPSELAGLVGDENAKVVKDAPAALAEVSGDARLLVCGSLFLAGEVLCLIEGGEFEASTQ